jgi:hypothetical protein
MASKLRWSTTGSSAIDRSATRVLDRALWSIEMPIPGVP